ncbi:hypothetical protein CERSUDRAFT_48567 [Gelatoporia subvermispora B]|uniref:Nucleolus and neural progenitor protein-like N-terminal domain-containing protein n=1 Tax=Ceriporiopsis subvermispora (strain B) TaxID=914234 RepID=M2RIB3_CERS8|nr:hypothetical protein CERSUDRAFT_48567 [Gelatoporia subvermispora B]
MGPRRFQPPPPLVYSTRSSIDSEKHSDVDAALKQLKTCTRRLQAALSAHRTELQVLERLYYKGKNQHRQALFWRRVEETRKYGERLNGMAMHELVEALRLSFWGDAWREKPKLLRGPWTHVPNKEVGLHVLRRCSDCLSLIRKVSTPSETNFSDNHTLKAVPRAIGQCIPVSYW